MPHSIAIIGLGPRGLYALEHLTRRLAENPMSDWVRVHLIEPTELGAGPVYRTTQPEYLKMNTVVSQMTAYGDAAASEENAAKEAPTMYQWMLDQGVEVEAQEYGSRAGHGRYLKAVFRAVAGRVVPRMTLHIHRCRAMDIEPFAGMHRVVLDEGNRSVIADVVLLTTGHSSHGGADHDRLGGFAEERQAQGNTRIQYLPVVYPAEKTIEALGPDVTLGVRGMGLTSIDAITAATTGNGGRYTRDAAGKLVYQRSGNEPRIVVWSRSGLPPAARAPNQKTRADRHVARFLTLTTVSQLRTQALANTGTRQLDFNRDVLPLLLCEMQFAYYAALKDRDFAERYALVARDAEACEQLLSEIPAADRFNWERLIDPVGDRRFADKAEFRAFLLDFMRRELREAAKGNLEGPIKAATDVLRDLRGTLRQIVEFGGLTAESHRWFDKTFWPIHNRIAVGPPAFRIEELVALEEAGVLDMSFGPGADVVPSPEHDCFQLHSKAFPAEPVNVDVLVDGRVAQPNLLSDRSSLLRNLRRRGLVRSFTNRTGMDSYAPCGIDINRQNQVVAENGGIQETLFAHGILTEGTRLYTLVAANPGVRSQNLLEADGWAHKTYTLLAEKEAAVAATSQTA